MGTVKIREIGNSNAHYRFYTFETFLKNQKRTGFQRVDLFGATPHVWIDAYSGSDGREVRKTIEDYGLTPGIFMPEFSSMRYTLGSEGSSYGKTRDYLKQCMEFAAGLGTDQVVIGANGFLLDREEKQRRFRLREALEYVSELAGPYGIRLLLLNDYSDRTSMIRTKEDMVWCMELMKGKNVGVAVDTGSVYEAGEGLDEWLSCFREKLGYICLSNTKFDGAKHYWGDGYLNLADIAEGIEAIGYTGAMGCHYMIRDYLREPWIADERTAEMLRWAFEEEWTEEQPEGEESAGKKEWPGGRMKSGQEKGPEDEKIVGQEKRSEGGRVAAQEVMARKEAET